MTACPYPQTGGAFLRDTLAYLDCQAQTLGAAGYQALAAPGSLASTALTSILTIFVAIFGIRLLLGHTPDARDGVTAAVKVGVVLVVATSWPAFRTIAYDVVINGPAQLVGLIGGAAALPGASGGMAERLQNVDDLLLYFASIGSGQPLLNQVELSAVDQARIVAQPVSDSVALGIGRTAYLTGVIAPLAIARLGAGFLLAVAPLFAGLLLFDATRGWFFGWLRALVAVAVGAAAIAVLLGAELAIVEPWLGDVLARRASGSATPAAAGELLALSLGFGVAAFGLLALMGKLSFSVHLPAGWTQSGGDRTAATDGTSSFMRSSTTASMVATQAAAGPNRAMLVSDAIARSDRRDVHMAVAAGDSGRAGRGLSGTTSATAVATPRVSAPVGQQFRRARPRVSASARRRDR